MANWFEPDDTVVSEWTAWVAQRPKAVREIITSRDFAPWKLYKLKPSGRRVTIHSFDEHSNGPPTMRVHVTGEFNAVAFERTVFGIKPEDLEECDLPKPGEPVGSLDLDPDKLQDLIGRG